MYFCNKLVNLELKKCISGKKIMQQTQMLIIGILTFIYIVIAGSPYQRQDVPTICLEEGACLKGTWYIGRNGSGPRFASFQGIRYNVI